MQSLLLPDTILVGVLSVTTDSSPTEGLQYFICGVHGAQLSAEPWTPKLSFFALVTLENVVTN